LKNRIKILKIIYPNKLLKIFCLLLIKQNI